MVDQPRRPAYNFARVLSSRAGGLCGTSSIPKIRTGSTNSEARLQVPPSLPSAQPHQEWPLRDRGVVGMWCLIVAESAIFTIFVVAYMYYQARASVGPGPSDVLALPIFDLALPWSSSAPRDGDRAAPWEGATFGHLWLATIVLALVFMGGTAREWREPHLREGLDHRTNLFGTTYYSLVGLHAFHVIVGIVGLSSSSAGPQGQGPSRASAPQARPRLCIGTSWTSSG